MRSDASSSVTTLLIVRLDDIPNLTHALKPRYKYYFELKFYVFYMYDVLQLFDDVMHQQKYQICI